jgi:hypothetical protein
MKMCARCGKRLNEPSGGAAQVMFGGFSISDSLEYDCKSCGAVYCIDCMSTLKKQGGICQKCREKLGW